MTGCLPFSESRAKSYPHRLIAAILLTANMTAKVTVDSPQGPTRTEKKDARQRSASVSEERGKAGVICVLDASFSSSAYSPGRSSGSWLLYRSVSGRAHPWRYAVILAPYARRAAR